MAVVSMKQLLEAGVHFGHQTRRWNPKMAQYIFTERNGIYIIDLQKTVKKLEEAYNFVRDLSVEGKPILFVGTKKQAQDSVKEEAERAGAYYVNARWLGGMMTNFRTIRRRVDRLKQLKAMEEDLSLIHIFFQYHGKGQPDAKQHRADRRPTHEGCVPRPCKCDTGCAAPTETTIPVLGLTG